MKLSSLMALVALVAIPSFAFPAFAQDEKAKQEKTEKAESKEDSEEAKAEKQREELLAKFTEELATAQQEMQKAAQAMAAEMQKKGPEARDEFQKQMVTLQQKMMDKHAVIGGKVMAAVKADKELALPGIMLVLNRIQNVKVRGAAIDMLIKDHLDSPEVSKIMGSLERGIPSESTERLYIALAEKSKDKETQARATISLVKYLRGNRDILKSMIDDENFKKTYADSLAYFKTVAATEDSRIEELLGKAAKEFADVKVRGQSIGEMAKRELKMMQVTKNLKVGKVAPDIEGPDIDGVNFKLSDYRGKVVLLDFWGDW